jgi:hypothetical protein
MSDRGSFVTEYIRCHKCLKAAKFVLLRREKYLCSSEIPGWDSTGEPLPIIAGKVGGVYVGEELDVFAKDLNKLLSKILCHSLRIAVLAESGERIFTVTPDVKEKSE